MSHGAFTHLARGDVIIALEFRGGWVRINTDRGDGWIFAGYLRRGGGAAPAAQAAAYAHDFYTEPTDYDHDHPWFSWYIPGYGHTASPNQANNVPGEPPAVEEWEEWYGTPTPETADPLLADPLPAEPLLPDHLPADPYQHRIDEPDEHRIYEPDEHFDEW
jgi:hypothetical protein